MPSAFAGGTGASEVPPSRPGESGCVGQLLDGAGAARRMADEEVQAESGQYLHTLLYEIQALTGCLDS